MDSLKRLINRLTCPRGISNEDAFDTVKQYWEDVTSGYWQDTDEELADELGVTPTALAELLEVHRHTFDYANVGGNSSVRGYDHGEDWLVVMFSDGSRYLYTLKSTDQQTLDYMRRLAMAGKGLNSYITRIVGPNYAGRNYKGTITIKPGMEQYNPEGYRRLLLIQAFRNTMTHNTISSEGLIADVKKFFGMSNKSARKMFIDNSFGWSIMEHIQRDILRPEWLKDQTYIKGDVSGKSVLKYIGKDSKVDIPGAKKQMDAFLAARVKVKKVTDEWRRKTKPVADLLVKNAKKLSPAVYAEAKELMAKIPMEKYTVDYPTKPLVGNGKKHENPNRVDFIYTTVDAMIPALDEAGALQLASDIQRSIDEFKKNMTGAPDEWPDVMNAMVYTMDPKDYGGVPYGDWYALIWDVLSPDTEGTTHNAGMISNRIYWDTIVGMTRYLDVSIKGDSIISGERFKVSPPINEVVMHNTLKRYKDQITTAGADGLDPVARGIMTVGLESMGYTTKVSTESIDDQPVNATQALEDVVDGALSHVSKLQASNEGIWGAIRYLFGGNYEDLPKINAAYDEAVDAVKSTYGNPEWVKARRLNDNTQVKVKSFIDVAKNPQAMFDKVKQTNANSFKSLSQYVKEEVEYLSKFTKALSSGDEAKIKALLDMFEVRKVTTFDQAQELNLGGPGDVKALDGKALLTTAVVFEEAVKYRRQTDAPYTFGLYRLAYTDSDKLRYGREGTETAKLQGSARELSLKIGESIENIEESFYRSFSNAWDNIDGVVRGTLMIMEASAK